MKYYLIPVLVLLLQSWGIAQIHYVQEMSSEELADLDKEKTIVLLPGGIIEKHGPYLPTFSDGYINESLTGEIADFISNETDYQVLVFPTLPIGSSGSHILGRNFESYGTFAVRDNTLRDIFLDIGSALGEQGFKKVFVIHNHGGPGHNLAIDQAAAYFGDRFGGRMINCWNLLFYAPQTEKDQAQLEEEGYISHSGMEETSIILYLNPDFVQREYQYAEPMPVQDTRHMIAMARQEEWPGYFGSPRLANAEFGEKAFSNIASHLIGEIAKILNSTFDFGQPTYYEIIRQDTAMQHAIEEAHAFDEEKTSQYHLWLEEKGW
jgi:creatinine amidohydrolase/Fe(II)-dependent formamide hydrolase-like protein